MHFQKGKVTKDMCFYITKEFQSNPPEPLDPEVKVIKSEERIFLVKQFGGFAMQDSIWVKKAENFRFQLQARSVKADFRSLWTAGYDPPWKVINRRNEVAFQTLN